MPDRKKVQAAATKTLPMKLGREKSSGHNDVVKRAPQVATRSARSVGAVSTESKAKTPNPVGNLSEHEQWFVTLAKIDRDHRIRQLIERIQTVTVAAHIGKTPKGLDDARKALAGLREEIEDVLSHRLPAPPNLPRTMLAVGLIGRLERGAIGSSGSSTIRKMIVELYSVVKDEDGLMPVLDDESILNEGHPVLLCGIPTKNVVDDARMLLNETLVVSGTYRNGSGTIYRIEPLKLNSEHVRAAFDELVRNERSRSREA